MIDKIPAVNRHFNNFGWLKTYWLFSFSSYYDPQNIGHGTLRVCNDDVVKLNTDATLFRASLEAGTAINYRPKEERKTFISLLDGTLVINENIMNKSDQARISGVEQLLIQASSAADFLLIDIPAGRQL